MDYTLIHDANSQLKKLPLLYEQIIDELYRKNGIAQLKSPKKDKK